MRYDVLLWTVIVLVVADWRVAWTQQESPTTNSTRRRSNDEVLTISGSARGRLVGWNRAQELTFRAAADEGPEPAAGSAAENRAESAAENRAKEFSLPLSQLVRYGIEPEARIGQGLVLVDGSFLAGRVQEIDRSICRVRCSYLETSVPRALVRGVILSALDRGAAQRQMAAEMLAWQGSDDMVREIRGDQWKGVLVSESAEEPLFIRRRQTQVVLETAGVRRRFDPEDLRGLTFSAPLSPRVVANEELFSPLQLSLDDGSRFHVVQGEISAAGGLELELVCGLRLEIEAANFEEPPIRHLSPLRIAGAVRVDTLTPLRLRRVPIVGQPQIFTPEEIPLCPPGGVMVAGDEDSLGWYPHAISMRSGDQWVLARDRRKMFAPHPSVRSPTAEGVPSPAARDGGAGGQERWTFRAHLQGLGPAGDRQRLQFEVDFVDPAGAIQRGGVGFSGGFDEDSAGRMIELRLPAFQALILSVKDPVVGRLGGEGLWIDPLVRWEAPTSAEE